MIKFCKKCNTETQRYVGGRCKNCHHISTRKYRTANKDSELERHSKYRVDNAAKIRESNAKYRANNADKCRAAVAKCRATNPNYHVIYRTSNKEKLRKYNAVYQVLYYVLNKEKINLKNTKYRKENQDKSRVYCQNYHARKINNGGKISADIKKRLFSMQQGKCAYCYKYLGDDYHLDHIMPLSLGGDNTDNNIQLLHSKCNLQKHAKHPVDFMQSKGYLL